MAKFKINRNKPDLPDEQINRHKDFGKLLANHQQISNYKDATKPLYKNPGFMSFIVILSVVLLTYLITERETEKSDSRTDSTVVIKKDQKQEEKTNTDTTAKVTLPKEKDTNTSKAVEPESAYLKPEIKFSSYKIDPKKGAMIYHGSTRILIPSQAFKDASGNLIQSEVEILYREFKDPVDAFLAGIPMHYDSTGKQFNLASAGMFEIKGTSGQQVVYIKSPITVEMATADHGNKYNSYFFNEKTKQWEYKGIEKQSMRFMVQADEKEYPELKPFKNLIWEFTINKQQKDPNEFRHIFSKTWSSFFVNEAAVSTTKDVKLKHNASEPKFLAYPIPLLNDKEANDRIMKAKFDEYYSLLKTKDKVARDLADAIRRQQEWLNSPQGKAYLEWAKSSEGEKQILSSRVATIFSVENFGIWNCDTPINLPQAAKLTPAFIDQFGKKLELESLTLVDYSINSTFLNYKGKPVQFNPKSNNVLWAALPGGKLAVFSKEKFKSIKQTSGNYTFNMEVVDINGKDANAIRTLLGMKEHATAKAEVKDKDPVATYERVIQLKKEVRESDVFFQKGDTTVNSNGRTRAEAERAKLDAANKAKDLLKKKW